MRSTDARIWLGKQGNRHVGHTRWDDVAQISPMEELAHDLLANRQPFMWVVGANNVAQLQHRL